jgi:hypothetical protein
MSLVSSEESVHSDENESHGPYSNNSSEESGHSSGDDSEGGIGNDSGGGDGNGSEGDGSQGGSGDGPHEALGPCPHGHDNFRDCRCNCAQCPNVDILEETTRRIRLGGYFHQEPVVDHGDIPDPYHNERSWLPPMPLSIEQLQARLPFMRRPHLVTNPIYAAVSGFDEIGQGRGEMLDPDHAQDHHSMTIAMLQKPCTELTPWNSRISAWNAPCPNDRRGEGGLYMGESWPCNEVACGEEEKGLQVSFWDHNGDWIDPDNATVFTSDIAFEDTFDEDGEESPPEYPMTWNNTRWVCEDHDEDNATYWQEYRLIEMHRVPTCIPCKNKYRTRYPDGFNTCTCPNLLGRWQCRRCYEKKIRLLQAHFKERVCAHYIGRINPSRLPEDAREGPGLSTYHKGNRAPIVKRLLLDQHPCINPGLSARCGSKRARNHRVVLHCRSCGGVVVKASRRPPVARAIRPRERQTLIVTRTLGRNRGAESPLQELIFERGRPIARNV